MARGKKTISFCWNSLLGVMCFVSIVILFVFSSAILACIANERGTTLGTHARLLLWIYCLERSRKASDSLDHRSLSLKCLVEGDNGFAAVDAYYYWWCYFSHGYALTTLASVSTNALAMLTSTALPMYFFCSDWVPMRM